MPANKKNYAFLNEHEVLTYVMAYVGAKNKPENKELYDLLHAKELCVSYPGLEVCKIADPEERKRIHRNN